MGLKPQVRKDKDTLDWTVEYKGITTHHASWVLAMQDAKLLAWLSTFLPSNAGAS